MLLSDISANSVAAIEEDAVEVDERIFVDGDAVAVAAVIVLAEAGLWIANRIIK